MDLRNEAKDRGEEPQPMFFKPRSEVKKSASKWRIRRKARDSKYAIEIKQILDIINHRNVIDPDLRLYRTGVLHCLEGIDEEREDVDLPEDLTLQHKIVRLLNMIHSEAEDMELSDDSNREQEVSNESEDDEDPEDEDDGQWSDCTSSSEDESARKKSNHKSRSKSHKSKRSRSKGKGKGKGKSSRK